MSSDTAGNGSSAAGRAVDAVIVGAGFAGLYLVHHLRDRLGLSVAAFEAGDGVGGTWYWNRYPGARCDSESYYYSYSFSPELEQEWNWSSKYPEQPEILRYLEHVADRFDIRRSIRFGTRVTAAHFDDTDGSWDVRTDRGDAVRARYFISAVGCLSSANVPDIPGLDRFQGRWVHTGRWPQDGVDFSGQRVGLIGTGSTGIQSTPVIARAAEHLYVFQRTPNYSIPARNHEMTEERNREIKNTYAEIRRRCRDSFAGFPYIVNRQSALEVSPEERTEIFERLWSEAGGFQFLYGSFYDLLRDQAANDTAAEFIRSKIRETVTDPVVAEMLCPTDHPFGTKRPPVDTDYFATFNRDNVTLIDVRRSPILEITEKGILTAEAEYPLDIIVFATGFDAMTGSLLKIDIRGRNGVRLADRWAGGPNTYLGMAVAGFPNLFMVTGPGSPSVLANMPMSIEQHVEWIGRCLVEAERRGAQIVEATAEAEEEWGDQVAAAVETTLYAKANSWYVGANIPGKQRVFMPYTGGFAKYESICEQVVDSGYEGFVFDTPVRS
ncbi:MAG TPA: NAD(P)/FAD-dependent oxidoreductase [Acidimicrobiales bacterium]|jgi:cation diffusion facilitator CzcD-associated flavoprotein CzcO|nr:NAD(P)/FAD-dependent oxidoreductase [Acidimicrobiales bacterium]